MKHATLSTILLATVVLAAGCAQSQKPGTLPPHFGPTQTMAEVVTEINANNAKLPTLWTRHKFEVNIVDPETKKKTFANGEGVMLYKSPHGLRLSGDKFGTGNLFEIGSNEERYWLKLTTQETMWWGQYKNLGKPCVDMSRLPVRPDMVLEVLGVGMIGSNFLAPPAPVMRFNNDTHAYMFVWSVPLADRWAAQKEIWYDLNSKLPTRVFLFDENGRVVLRAKLSNHQPVESEGVAKEKWPKVARRYELFFPDTGSSMKLDLDETAPDSDKGVLARYGIVFPKDPKVDRVVQLDENCAD